MLERLGFCLLTLVCAANRAEAQSHPNRVVLGYSASWFDAKSPPEFYNYDGLTHLARSFLTPRLDGSIDVPEGYFNATMETQARRHGVKLLMSLGGEADNADNWLSIPRHPEYLNRFLGQLGKLMADHGYDGIDIDWEPSPLTDADGIAYTSLLKSLRERFPKAILTTALGASDYWISHFSWKDVCDSVDYVNVMVYDYSGGWGGRAAYASNLYPPGAYPPQPEYSVDQGMKNLIVNHHVPPSKLLLGVTFWASRFAVDHIGDSFPVNAPGYSMNVTYSQTMDLLETGRYREFWDEAAAMPYLERTGGGSVVCYENPRSIKLKCDYAKKLGCAGVMIWHVGADVYRQHAPLMDALAQSCGVEAPVLPREILMKQIVDLQEKDGHAAESDAAKLRNLSEDKLNDLCRQLEIKSGIAQDQVWQAEAAQRLKH
jgi:chitinase